MHSFDTPETSYRVGDEFAADSRPDEGVQSPKAGGARPLAIACAVMLTAFTAACGSQGSSTSKPATPGGITATTRDTIPLANEDSSTKFFKANKAFQTCLKDMNVKFIGAPDKSNPNSPTNDPNYTKAVSTCAARSGILQSIKDQQTAGDNLTPAQIATQNKAFLKFRECMIGRGWGIPEPKPDSRGRLTPAVPNFTPPAGQDATSPDIVECAAEAQK